MAFFRLSQELRDLIFALLDRQSLLLFSRSSKQFRSFAEDFMYQVLSFEDHSARQIRRMLLLFIARPDLAKRIRSVSFAPKKRVDRYLRYRPRLMGRASGSTREGHPVLGGSSLRN
jgi:hypothetical protein